MSAQEDDNLDEKRVFGAREGSTLVFVAAESGVAQVEVAADRVGEFSLVYSEPAYDVIASGGRLAIAGTDVLLVGYERLGDADALEETGFGPATAVGFNEGIVAAGEGRVGHRMNDDWMTLGKVTDVRAIAGNTLAAADGVFRLDGTYVGLDDAYDVTVDGELLAATGDGLYRLGNGWMMEFEGGFRAVTSNGASARAIADDGTLYARDDDGEWTNTGAPGNVVDVSIVEGTTYAVTVGGTFLADAGDGWRDHSIGLPESRRLAVP